MANVFPDGVGVEIAIPEAIINDENGADYVNDQCKKWMKKVPPKGLSGDVMHLTIALLFENVIYKDLPPNYRISPARFLTLIEELKANLLPMKFLILVTVEAINKKVEEVRKKANITEEDRQKKQADREEKTRSTQEKLLLETEARRVKAVADEASLTACNTLLVETGVNIQDIKSTYNNYVQLECYHDGHINKVKLLFDIYKIQCPKLKGLGSKSLECGTQASEFDDAMKKMILLLKDEKLDWVTTYLASLTADPNVQPNVNSGREFDAQKGSKFGSHRNHNDGLPSDIKGGKYEC
jgi:hypothetical protein